MTNCFNEISKSIALNCQHPLVKGNSGRAILIPWAESPEITKTGNKITALTLGENAVWVAIENAITTPFDGTASASTDEDGYKVHTKTFAFRVPERGAAVSEQIIDPMVNSAAGYLVIVEKNDKAGDGSYEVLGYESPLRVNGDGVTQNESENGGAIMVTMSAQQTRYSYALVPAGADPFAAAKAIFDGLWNGAAETL